MRIAAYVLSGAAFIDASVMSYYDFVEEIIFNYDRSGLAWTRTPIDSFECIEKLQAVDRDQKIRFCPGDFSSVSNRTLYEWETFQRQSAIDQVSPGIDWVLQIDSDEIISNPETFLNCLKHAHERGFAGLHYPSRNLFQYAGQGRFLEHCQRLWRIAATYPGAAAVRAGTRLKLCRQIDRPVYRVDFKAKNTDPWHPKDVVVHEVIEPQDAIWHLSWIRTEEQLRKKASQFAHADEFDWSAFIKWWLFCKRHPYIASLGTVALRRKVFDQLRVTVPPSEIASLAENLLNSTSKSIDSVAAPPMAKV